MFEPVSRTPLRPPVVSLLSAARPAPDGPERWESGLAFASASCGRVRVVDPCSGQSVLQLDHGTFDPPDYVPFDVQAEVTCSTGSGPAALQENRTRALEELDYLTPFAVERELWTGELARKAGNPNRALVATDAAVTAGQVRATVLSVAGQASVSPLAAVGLLEEALGSYPGESYLHASLRGATFLSGQTTREGNLLRTKLGSVLVPGRGYPGTGPDGTAPAAGTTWVYGTGPVTVRTSPGVVSADPAQTVDRGVNTVTVQAERMAAATWDGCPLFAVLMTLKSD